MAIEVFSEIPNSGISPRISFSHDLDQKEDPESIDRHHRRLDASLLDSSSDFDFCFGNNSFVQELPSADELFCNGKILPIEIKKKQQTFVAKQVHFSTEQQQQQQQQSTATTDNTGKKRLKEYLSMSIDGDDRHKPSASKSFWQFKRSNSLNCESTRSKSLIRSSLNQLFLSRSNSTGSAPNPKPTLFSKETQNQKQPSLSRKSSLSRTSGGAFYNSTTQKPPLKKNCGAYGNGSSSVRVSPVLNLPHYATVSFFGFGSIFCNGKAKKKKR